MPGHISGEKASQPTVGLGRSDFNAFLDVPAFQETVELLTTLYASPWPTLEEVVLAEDQPAVTLFACTCYNEFAEQLAKHYPTLLVSIERKLGQLVAVPIKSTIKV